MRKQMYFWSKDEIRELNSDPENTYRCAINALSDQFDCEYDALQGNKDRKKKKNQYEMTPEAKERELTPYDFDDGLPEFVDWRKVGAVSSVKNQMKP